MSLRGCVLGGRGVSRQRTALSWRSLTAFYGVCLFLAVASARHRHVNAFEDLLSGGPSDSGTVITTSMWDTGSGPSVGSARLIDDDPCLACFQNDYVASAGVPYLLP